MRASASSTRSVAVLARRAAPWRWPKPACVASWLAFHMAGRSSLRSSCFDLGDAVGVGLPGGPGGGERRLEVGELGGGLGAPVGSVGEIVGEIVAVLLELGPPRVDPAGNDRRRLGRPGSGRVGLVGEVAALGDGGDVGPVVGEDGVEDVAGLGEVGGVGDDVDAVLVAAAGGADVQAAVGGGRRDEGDGDVDGVGLVAVLGGGVAEPDVVPGVVGGEGDGAVSAEVGHGERPVAVGGDDVPQVAVADRLTRSTCAAPGRCGGWRRRRRRGRARRRRSRTAASGSSWPTVRRAPLDGVVEGVDVVVGGGGDGDRPAVGGEAEPVVGDPVEVVVEGAGDDPAVGLVGVERRRVAGAQLQRGGGFPRVGEAVEAGQLVHPAGGAQLGEQPAPADGLQLAGVTDQREPPAAGASARSTSWWREGVPSMPASSTITVVPAGSRYAVERWPVGAVPLVEQLGDGVGGHAGLAFQDAGRLGRRGDTEHRPVPRRPGRRRRARSMVVLPAPAGPTTTTSRSVPATAAAASACNTSSPARIDGRSTVPGSSAWASIAQVRTVLLLGEDRVAGEVRGGRLQPHRPAIRRPAAGARAGRVEIDAARRSPGRRPVPGRPPSACPDIEDTGGWRSQIARSTSARVHVEPDAESWSMTSLDGHRRRRPGRSRSRRRRRRRRAGSAVQPSSAASAATVSADPRQPLPVLWPRVSADASRSQRGPLPAASGPGPPGAGTRRPCRPARRRPGRPASRTPPAARPGMPAISAWPLTIGSHADPVAVGQLGAQHRLVQAAQHPLVALQVAGVQRQPPPVVGLDLGRDDGVGVQLRVIGPRRRLAERRHRQPERVGVQAAAVDPHPGRRPEPLQMLERRASRRRRGRRADRDRRSAPTTRSATSAPRTWHRTRPPPAPPSRPPGRPVDQRRAQRCPRRSGHGPPTAPADRRPSPDRTGRARRPDGPTTRPAPRPARPGSGCSTPPSPTADDAYSVVTRSISTHPPPAGTCL